MWWGLEHTVFRRTATGCCCCSATFDPPRPKKTRFARIESGPGLCSKDATKGQGAVWDGFAAHYLRIDQGWSKMDRLYLTFMRGLEREWMVEMENIRSAKSIVENKKKTPKPPFSVSSHFPHLHASPCRTLSKVDQVTNSDAHLRWLQVFRYLPHEDCFPNFQPARYDICAFVPVNTTVSKAKRKPGKRAKKIRRLEGCVYLRINTSRGNKRMRISADSLQN